MEKTRLVFCCLTLFIFLSSCATQSQIARDQVLKEHQPIKELSSALNQAKKSNAHLLAPEAFVIANDALDQAISAAIDNDLKTRDSATLEGSEAIKLINTNVKMSRDILEEVMEIREKAYSAGANTSHADEISALDSELTDIAASIENGNIELAKKRRPKLVNEYSKLELKSLKQRTSYFARDAIAKSKKNGADKYAPKTLALAKEELTLASSVLDADRNQVDKASVHAIKAGWLAEKSTAITEIVKDFDRREYTAEDIVLWYQSQLYKVSEPLGSSLPLNKSNKKVVFMIKGAIKKIVEENNKQEKEQLIAQINKLKSLHKRELATLRNQYEEKLTTNLEQRQLLAEKERIYQDKFEHVQLMFDTNEANVYRRRQNIFISAQGFEFPPGKGEIQVSNFQLMNKIIRAVKQFPDSRIEVRGHTDSTGIEKINQDLSNIRAANVAKFLSEVGEVAQKRISFHGFGESKPVASNETPEGRSENRRVEVAILND